MTLERIRPLPAETVELVASVDWVAAHDLFAIVDSPSVDTCLKNGYAVRSSEVGGATADRPVRLKLTGHMAVGGTRQLAIEPGATVRNALLG